MITGWFLSKESIWRIQMKRALLMLTGCRAGGRAEVVKQADNYERVIAAKAPADMLPGCKKVIPKCHKTNTELSKWHPMKNKT